MTVKMIVLGLYGTNCYIVYDENTMNGIVIDPGYTPELVLQELNNLGVKLQAVLLTHGHFDHVGGTRALHEATGCKVYLNEKDSKLPEYLTAGPLFYTDFYGEGDELDFDSLHFRVIETPGHTEGSICLFCGDTIFSGDTLFKANVGRTDGPGGSWKEICRSLRRLSEITGDYKVLSGHGEPTTLRREQLYNSFMQEANRQ